MYNEKKKITNERYLSKFKTKAIRIPLDELEQMEKAAAAAGKSLAGYILQATEEKMARDGFTPAESREEGGL